MAGVPVVPQLDDREVWELQIAAELGTYLTEQERELLELMGEELVLGNADQTFWDDQRDSIVPALALLFAGVFSASVEQLPEKESLFIPIDIPTVQDKGSEWAQGYSFELVSGINDTTRDQLQSKVSQAIEADFDLEQLRESLTPQFGPTRAAMIAQTETTRAAIRGEIEAVAELEREHQIVVEGIWETHPELSATGPCPICAPLDGTVQGTIWFDPPPAHVRCVCGMRYRLVEDARSAEGRQ